MFVFNVGVVLAVSVAVRLPQSVLPVATCKDTFDTCSSFAHNHCKHRPDSLKQLCKKSCGICTKEGCAYGYYGSECSPCQNLCLQGDESCGKREGPCAQNCTSGYGGRDCNIQCSIGCLDNACDKWSGFCINGCNKGYYGRLCQRSCPPNCKGGTCGRLRDVCGDGCKRGWYGPRCFHRCPVRCAEGRCEDGNCTVGCEKGWWGPDCKTSCPMHCENNTCSRHTGMCFTGCKAGWLGDGCLSRCPANCQKGTCDKKTGNLACRDGCNRGWFGLSCDSECGLCIEKNCSQTGRCLSGCVRGRFGHSCSHICPDGCVNKTCHQLADESDSTPSMTTRSHAAGECLGECKEGRSPVLCNLTCAAGCAGGGCVEGRLYGTVCNRSCECCDGAEGCQQNGTCFAECGTSEERLAGSRVHIAGWVTSWVSVGMLLVVGFILYIRKRQVSGCRQQPEGHTYVSFHASLENLVIHDYDSLEFGRDNEQQHQAYIQEQETVHADNIYLSCTVEPI